MHAHCMHTIGAVRQVQWLPNVSLGREEKVGGHSNSTGRMQSIWIAVGLLGFERIGELLVRKDQERL